MGAHAEGGVEVLQAHCLKFINQRGLPGISNTCALFLIGRIPLMRVQRGVVGVSEIEQIVCMISL